MRSAGGVSVQELQVAYPGAGVVLQLEHYHLPAGAIGVVAGPSGAGKSTLGHAVAGLLPWLGADATGQVHFGNLPFRLENAHGWRGVRGRRVRWIPQEPAGAFTPTLPLLGQMLEGLPPSDRHRPDLVQLLAALDLPPVEEMAHRYPYELSGGQLQRAAVVSAFLNRPDLVVADEPTAHLDPPRTLALARSVTRLAADSGSAVLWITHDLRLAAAVADELMLLEAGRCIARGAPAHLLDATRPQAPPIVQACAGLALPL